MSNQDSHNGAMQEVRAILELTKAQKALAGEPLGLIARAALATLYMYVVFLGHQLMGAAGAIYVSGLFLVSAFLPVAIRVATRYWGQRRGSGGRKTVDLGEKLHDET